MNGVISRERERLDSVLRWLERGIAVGGVTVVLGLLLEYGPDIARAIAEQRWPSRITIGGILVTVGVFLEVLLGILVTRYAGRVQALANSTIAETRERAAQAARAAAEANLARIRLEQQIARRDISDEDCNVIIGKLSKFAGQRITIFAFPQKSETLGFAARIASTLNQAGWKVELSPKILTSPFGLYSPGFSITSTPDAESKAAGYALLVELAPVSVAGMGGCLVEEPNEEGPQLVLVIQERLAPSRPVKPPQA